MANPDDVPVDVVVCRPVPVGQPNPLSGQRLRAVRQHVDVTVVVVVVDHGSRNGRVALPNRVHLQPTQHLLSPGNVFAVLQCCSHHS